MVYFVLHGQLLVYLVLPSLYKGVFLMSKEKEVKKVPKKNVVVKPELIKVVAKAGKKEK